MTNRHLAVKWGLLLFGLITTLSGILIQINYHIGSHSTTEMVWGFNHLEWNFIHKWSAVLFSLLTFFHVLRHWKWYRSVFERRLFRRNRRMITLSLLMFFTILFGIIPWLLFLLNNNVRGRTSLIEIHDKIAILLIPFIILHLHRKFHKNQTHQ